MDFCSAQLASMAVVGCGGVGHSFGLSLFVGSEKASKLAKKEENKRHTQLMGHTIINM